MIAGIDMQGWLTLAACTGLIGLAVVALRRAGESHLGAPLASLCIGLFAWNFASLAHAVSGAPGWRYLDVASSPMTVPLTVAFIVAFVGKRREQRRFVVATFIAFGALAICALLAFAWPWAREFSGSPEWAAILGVGAVLCVIQALRLLQRHVRESSHAEERVRARLVLTALVVGAALALTELFADMGFDVPRGGSLGALAAAGVLGVVVLRFRLLEAEFSKRVLFYSLSLGALAVVAYLGVFYFMRASSAMLLLGTATVTFGLVAALRHLTQSQAAQRERLERLALLGRFSAQMAHDLKNPIAAMRGAVQFLTEERARGGSLDEHGDFLELVAEQIERVHGVVDRYHRLGHVEIVRHPAQLNQIVRDVLSLQGFAGGSDIEVHLELDDGLPNGRLDADLVARALENLVRNSVEAMPDGGTLTVRTGQAIVDGRTRLSVRVEDVGAGMDARVLERAFDDFFTTKSQGSGLGLFFVKRVAEAHQGDVRISSQPGCGTVAELMLPAT